MVDVRDSIGHGEQDRIFFNHLDGELEKINSFYKAKESEYVARAIRLEKQLLALFQVQEALARQNLKMRASSFNQSHQFSQELNPSKSPHTQSFSFLVLFTPMKTNQA